MMSSRFFFWVKMNNLKLLDETVMIQRDDKHLFLVPSKPDWLVTNVNGSYLLSLCSGNRDMSEIQKEAENKGFSEKEVKAFLSRLVESNFFEPKAKVIPIQPALKPILSSVHLNMHKDCNLKCVYCYAEDRVKEGNSLSLEEYKKLIDELSELGGVLHIEFTGGEPLLNRSTIEVAKYAKSLGHTVKLLTNATPINLKNAEEISNTFDSIRISIDGDEHANELLRGFGTYKQITDAIAILDGFGAKLQIAMTVTKKNIDQIAGMTARYGNRLTFQPLFNAGTARLNKELAISGEEYYEALANVNNVNVVANRMAPYLEKLKNRGTVKCAIGDVEISISHDGVVYPCHLIHVEEFAAGNIRETHIKDIYEGSPALKASRELVVSERPGCSECPVRLLCGGACRARAYYLEGDINAADRFCEYEFKGILEGLFNSVVLSRVQ